MVLLAPTRKIELNLLHLEISNQKLSAHATQEGMFDFNKTSLDPTGTKVIVHGKPGKCKSWDPHRVDGCYLRSAMENYICYTVYINKMRVERTDKTVDFLP